MYLNLNKDLTVKQAAQRIVVALVEHHCHAIGRPKDVAQTFGSRFFNIVTGFDGFDGDLVLTIKPDYLMVNTRKKNPNGLSKLGTGWGMYFDEDIHSRLIWTDTMFMFLERLHEKENFFAQPPHPTVMTQFDIRITQLDRGVTFETETIWETPVVGDKFIKALGD